MPGTSPQDAVDDSAVRVAALLEAADRIDSVAYVYAALPMVEQVRRPGGRCGNTSLWLARWPADGVDFSAIPELAFVEDLGARSAAAYRGDGGYCWDITAEP